MSQTILYDLPARGDRPACWSYNPWKIRLALNFKGIDYKTEWVEYPEIEGLLSPHVPPNPPTELARYTIPTVRFPDNTWIMNGIQIATRLEKDHPSPPLHLDDPTLGEVSKVLPTLVGPLRGVYVPGVASKLLNPSSKEYFVRTREKRFGMSLAQLQVERGGEEAWVEALPGIKGLGEILGRNGGPFVRGAEVSYADFVIVGFLRFLKTIDEDIYKKIVKIEPALETLFDASKQWLERDGH